MGVHKSFVYYDSSKYYCYDGSNVFLSLRKGDEISVIITGQPYTLVKYNGSIGLIETKYIYEDNI